MKKKLVFILTTLVVLVSSCQMPSQEAKLYNYDKNDPQYSFKLVELGNELGNGSLTLKKVYIKDHNGYTHEILIAGTRTCDGGEHMLELCKYK